MRNYSFFIHVLSLVFILLLPNVIFAQTNAPDFMRSIGKIYVVVGVIALIFIGIIFYIIKLDLKISKLEKTLKQYGES